MSDIGEKSLIRIDDDADLIQRNNKIQIMERECSLKNLKVELDKLDIQRERIGMKMEIIKKELEILTSRRDSILIRSDLDS